MRKGVKLLIVSSLMIVLVGCNMTDAQEYSEEQNYSSYASTEEQDNINDGTEENLHVHEYSNATCTTPSKCSCGKTTGSALGHSYSGKYCTRCGAKNPNYKEQSTMPSHTHYYDSEVTTEATCASEGVRTYKCSCGHKYTEKISKKSSHNWEYATCTAPKTCKDCGKTEGSAKEHNYYSDGKCGYCGELNPIVSQTLEKCSLSLPALPKRVSHYSYSDTIYTTVSVTEITYEFKCNNDGEISLDLYFSGTKTYDHNGSGQSNSCKIGWKLYGPNGAVVESDTFYSPSVAEGESFSNQKEYGFDTYDKLPAGAYRLEIMNVN